MSANKLIDLPTDLFPSWFDKYASMPIVFTLIVIFQGCFGGMGVVQTPKRLESIVNHATSRVLFVSAIAYTATSDIETALFATAILLYEMLTNKKLYSNKATLETLESVRKADIKPVRELNSNVHPELEKILKKSLRQNPNDRYQTALEFEDALASYIFKHNLKVITNDVAESLRLAFTYKKEIDQKIAAKTDTIDQLILNALLRVRSIKEGEDVNSVKYKILKNILNELRNDKENN